MRHLKKGYYIAILGILIRLIIPSSPHSIYALQSSDSITTVDWSRNGNLLAIGYSRGRVEVRDISGNEIVASYQVERGSANILRFSPSNDFVAIGTSRSVTILDLVNQDEFALHDKRDYMVWSVAWHPNGTELAIVTSSPGGSGADYWIRIWDIKTREVQANYQWHGSNSVAWSPDGSYLACTSYYFDGGIIDTTTREHTLNFDQSEGHLIVAWNPNSSIHQVATGDFDGNIYIWDVETGQLLHTFQTNNDRRRTLNLVWNPQGTLLASVIPRNIIIWDVAHQSQLLTIDAPSEEFFSDVAWSPDGMALLYAYSLDWQIEEFTELADFYADESE